MTLKQFKTIKLITVVVLAIIISQSLVNRNYAIPLLSFTVSIIFLHLIRQRVKEIIADERDYEIGGKSAWIAMQTFSWIAAIIMFILYSMRDINPAYGPIAFTLSYSVCFLLLIYSFIFNYYYKK